MINVFFACASLLMCVSSVSLMGAQKHDSADEGVLGSILEAVGDMAQATKDTFKAASKKLIGKRRHDNMADYFSYLAKEAHKAGKSTADFIADKWEEIKPNLTEDEEAEIEEHIERSEYEAHYRANHEEL